MSPWVWWLVAAVVFAVGEMLTTTLFIAPFAAGALGAMALDLAGGEPILQVVVFLAVSAAAFTIVRPIARRHRSMPPQIRTGTAALIGRTALVLEEVTPSSGTVKLDGEVWTARPYDEESVLGPGEHVHVIEIRGATALVSQ